MNTESMYTALGITPAVHRFRGGARRSAHAL